MTSLIRKAAETLNEVQLGVVKVFCEEHGLSISNPVYYDYMKIQGYLAKNAECRVCKGDKTACSAKKLYTENGVLKSVDIGCPVSQAKQIIKYSNVPVKFKNCRAENFLVKPVNAEYVAHTMAAIRNRDSLYIYGTSGTGKTMLSSIISNERAYCGVRTLFYTVTDMLADLKDFTDNFRREEKLLKLKTASCLIIDDIGAEYISDWVSATLFSIIDYRYKGGLQTIFTSNFDVTNLCKRYTGYHGDRISRRIKSMCKMIYLV